MNSLRSIPYASLLLLMMASVGLAQPVLVSATPTGTKQNGSCGTNCRVSDDGRYIAFESNAANLVGSAGAQTQILVKDMATGAIVLASKSPAGAPADLTCVLGDMSRDGRYVAFASSAANILGVPTSVPKIYRYDRITDTTQLVSVTLNGAAPNGGSFGGRFSDDGQLVLFESSANNLVPNDTNSQLGAADVFVRDMIAGVTERVNVKPAGAQDPNPPTAGGASMSGDGRYVTFDTTGSWSAQDTNNKLDVYVKDRLTGAVSLASIGLNGLSDSAAGSSRGRISANGNKVAFNSGSSAIVTSDTNSQVDTFVRDLTTGTSTVASNTINLLKPCSSPIVGSSLISDISEDGRFVLITSSCTDISFADTNEWTLSEYELYLHDSLTLRTYPLHVSTSTGETVANGAATGALSKNGRFIVISSSSTVFSPDDTDANRDVFLIDDVGFGYAGGGLVGPNGKPVLSGTGSLLPSSANTLRLTQTTPGSVGVIVLSLGFQFTPFKGGLLLTGFFGLVTIPFVSDAQGSLTLPFTMPPTPSTPGTVTIQALYADGSAVQGVGMSNAVFAVLR